MNESIRKELDKCYTLIKEYELISQKEGDWVMRPYYEGKIAGLEFALREGVILI